MMALRQKPPLLWKGCTITVPSYDGNKRTATAIGEIFLQENGYFIAVDDIFDAFYFFVQLFDDRTFLFHNLYPWLSEHIRPRS